jgi:glycosyltransferase involved in cell wall biosynthesis
LKNLLFIFEFGVPNYRTFILDHFKNSNSHNISSVSADDKFDCQEQLDGNVVAKHITGKGENRLYWFNPLRILSADYIVTTFNLRRPHTWLYILLFPWKKWIFWGQGLWKGGRGSNFLRKLLLGISNGYIVYTAEGKNNLTSFGYDESKISIAQNTLSVPNSEKVSKGNYLLYVGRLQERKGLELVFPYLKKFNLTFVIVGDGSYKDTLKKLAEQYEVSDLVRFEPGTFDENAIKHYFEGAMCYVSPGHVGLGVVHAFSYGCPVFTLQDREHAPEYAYCNNDNSYLISNVSDIMSGLSELCEDYNKLDKKRNAAFSTYITALSTDNVFSAFQFQLDIN